ncbi:MAG: hypothetical protein ABR568_21985 [Pyrinomonadaceae bacterium]
MATEVVVKHSLSDEMISAGAELTRRLDDARFIVSASLWLFTPETGGWRFVIGGGISGIRFTNNVINGTPIEDAYIYRIT